MLRLSLALLFLSGVALAQPLEGPWTVIDISTMATITNPHVTLRNADTADVFYQVADTVFHAAVTLQNGQVVAGPEVLVSPQSGWTHILYDALWSDDRWYALDYADGSHSNVTSLVEGVNAATRRDTLSRQSDCPGSGAMWYCEESELPRLQARIGGGCYAYWKYDWQMHRFDGFEEGGVSSRVVRVTAEGDTATDCFFGIGPTSFLHVFPNDSINELACDGYQAHLRDIHSFNNCTELTAWDCNAVPLAATWTDAERLFVLSDTAGQLNARVLELTGGTCNERIALSSPPIAATSQSDYGLAWLTGGATELYLTRADTTGAMHLLPGLMAEPQTGYSMGEAALAMTNNGLLAALWVESSPLDSNHVSLRLATVGWNTPLGADHRAVAAPTSFTLSCFPNPFNSTLEIRFDMPRTQKVKLAVYNLLGQKVTTLFSGMKPAGSYRQIWSPSCAGGLYFVSMRTAGAVMTAKVLYLK